MSSMYEVVNWEDVMLLEVLLSFVPRFITTMSAAEGEGWLRISS